VERFRTTIFPLFLMLVTPLVIGLVWITCTHYDGSIFAFLRGASLDDVVRDWPRPSLVAAKIIGAFAVLEAVLLVVLPGKTHLGPVTPAGNRPRYKLNGIAAYVATHVILYVAAYHLHWFSPSIVYDNFGSILTTLTLFALAFCLFLYFKGSFFPSSTDAGRSGNFIWDYYWGVELHPSVLGYSLKQYTNCRVGMMGWSVAILAFLAKQHEATGHVSTSMWVSAAIQVAYIVKFFYWESGYFGSLDIMHDRFGYYICWGVLCWIPGVYTLVSFYLVTHPIELSAPYAAFCLLLGLGSIWANYDADAQRQRVRQTNGKCTVWGKEPDLILARYTTADGEERENLLLASGWWGLARHFHYIPEITLSLAWTLPAMFDHLLPYFYVVYLTILLLDRSGRDEIRCAKKYGSYWDHYRERVRSRIIPLLF
jgi:7-dehydrocholesterol reductase